jgi:hypothetical protein
MKRDILRIIAASELLGGIFVLSGYALLALGGYRLNPAWQALPAVAFGAFAMVSGIALYRGRRWGVRASMLLQLLQIASFSIVSHLRYVALVGPIVQLIIATTGVRLEVGGGGAFVAVPWSQDGSLGALGVHLEAGLGFQPGTLADSEFTMGVNLLAIYFLWRLSAFVAANDSAATDVSVAPAA